MSDFTLQDESQTPAQKPKIEAATLMRDVSCGLPQICSSQQKTYISYWENYHHHHHHHHTISESCLLCRKGCSYMKQFVPSSSILRREDDELHLQSEYTLWPRQYITQPLIINNYIIITNMQTNAISDFASRVLRRFSHLDGFSLGG